MGNSFLTKRKEKPKIKTQVKPITMCEIFFKKGYVLNNSKVIKSEKPDFVLGNELTFVESGDVVYARFINDGSGIVSRWTVYQGGEYAKIIKTN